MFLRRKEASNVDKINRENTKRNCLLLFYLIVLQ